MTNTHTPTPGHHIGPLPTDEQAQASLQAVHVLGYSTTLGSSWQKLQSAGNEPDVLNELMELA